MTAALITLSVTPAAVVILGLAGARAGVVSLHVRRPPKARKPKTEASHG